MAAFQFYALEQGKHVYYKNLQTNSALQPVHLNAVTVTQAGHKITNGNRFLVGLVIFLNFLCVKINLFYNRTEILVYEAH